MADFFESIILGIVQGLTEWLPVSSSGHLALIQNFLNFQPNIFLNVMLHVGTLFVVLLFYRKDIRDISKKVAGGKFKSPEAKLAFFIVLGSIPTALVGFLLRDFIEELYQLPALIGVALIITAALLFLTKFARPGRSLMWTDALLIGLIQGLAIAPGISRSGATIAVALLIGINRSEATKFSFLLSIPAIAGAGLILALEAGFEAITLTTLLGMLVAFIIGYVSLKFVVDTVIKNKFWLFGYYCAALGIIVLIVNIIK